MINDLFDSAVRSEGDFAGVFECDQGNAFFYLLRIDKNGNKAVCDTIHVFNDGEDVEQNDIAVSWDATEKMVGLFIDGVLWAVFNVAENRKSGGNYRRGRVATVGAGDSFHLLS